MNITGVVDQSVELVDLAEDVLNGPVDGRRLAKVAGSGDGGRDQCLHVDQGAIKFFAGTREKHDAGTVGGQFETNGAPNAFGGAGHEVGLAVEFAHEATSVGVEALTGLSSEFSFLNHLHQQRCRGVLFGTEALVEDVHDVENGVVADQVRKCQRPDGMIHPEFHDTVDGFGLGHAPAG